MFTGVFLWYDNSKMMGIIVVFGKAFNEFVKEIHA